MRFEPGSHYEDSLARAADECGIYREYWDIFGRPHHASTEVRRKILRSLGWKVDNHQELEMDRRNSFQSRAAAIVPRTLVISAEENVIPLSYAAGTDVAFEFEVRLENGGTLTGAADTSQLAVSDHSEMDGMQWKTYRLPLPSPLPLGYHTVSITANGHDSGE